MSQRPSRQAWLMVAGGFLAFTVSASLMHAYTVFLLAFIETFAWSRAEASLAYSVGQIVGGVSSPLVGGLVDRIGARRMVLLGGCLLTIGLFGSAQADALWQVVLLYGVVMTLGANCIGLVVFVPLVSRLFVAQRGMAISLLQSANGFGRAISAPIAQWLVDAQGWRNAYLMQAGLMGVLIIPLAAMFRRADTLAPAATTSGAATDNGRAWTLAEAIRTRHFWLLFLVYMLTSIGSFLVSLHQLAFAVGQGFEPLYAATVLGMGSLLALPGVILTGTLSDYIGREWAAILAYGISIVGVAAALTIGDGSQHLLLWLHACFFGITWGARGPAITAKTADLFGGPRLGTILGVITIGSGVGAGIGSWGAGLLFDLTGTYRPAFILSILAYALGAIFFWALRKPVAR
ncbi:MFS transporter [Neoroseomonas oryzicola]|uniref:MFS transporter n=1 Tax=Neoroseomonas oryzicola TaxID=535904 RepID=A0A9X9WH35_9PROT|nr:MFS transporter [Neoroseomonas oryzicola]MBR0659645.1 MFS transporter [Neoroseomonas oryzicola]NKE15494.1 MFS transporter [Neoroseomonas oryzicola]